MFRVVSGHSGPGREHEVETTDFRDQRDHGSANGATESTEKTDPLSERFCDSARRVECR